MKNCLNRSYIGMNQLNIFRHLRPGRLTATTSFILILSITAAFSSCSRETTVMPERGPVVEAVYALGTVKTDKIFNARFGMNTIIRKLYVSEGDTVEKNSPLVLGDTPFPITSPFSGVVTEIKYMENEMITAGQVALTVSSITSLYVKVSLDQESIISVKKGQPAEMSFENLRNEKVTGTVQSVYLSGDEFIVRITGGKFPDGILPQMTCDTAITVRKNDNALLIPFAAIRSGKVTVIRKGKRITIPVSVKKIDSRKAEVLDNSILPDDSIIAEKTGENSRGQDR